jgi:hypothetical protein
VSPAAGIEEKYVGAPIGESVMFSSDSGSITNDSLIVESIFPLLDPQCQRECGALTPSGDAGTSMVDLGFASKEHRTVESTSRLKKSISITKAAVEDSDMDFAKKLQATFDRENSLLATLERRRPPPKRRKIDSFFGKIGK